MKNGYVLALIIGAVTILSTSEIQSAQETKDKVLMGIVSNHTRVFGVDDMFKEQLNLSPWDGIVTEVKKFVEANAQGDKKLLQALTDIVQENSDLETIIQSAYKSLSNNAKPQVITLYNSGLEKVANEAQTIENSLTKAIYFMPSKKAAREVLSQFAMFIGTTALAAKKHLEKKMVK